MLKIDRQTTIESELARKGSVSIPELSAALKCSEETIRRDLKELESAGKLSRTHGGAYLMGNHDKSYPVKLRQIYYQETKQQLAVCALSYIKENSILMLDSSTTDYTLAEAILNAHIAVTIVTNSLLICSLCNDQPNDVNLICLGGYFRSRTASFVGYLATDTLNHYHADQCFISCPGVSIEQGMADNQLDESRVREEMFTHSSQKILILDHTKFDMMDANILFGDLRNADVLITDQKLPIEWERFCSINHIEISYSSAEK